MSSSALFARSVSLCVTPRVLALATGLCALVCLTGACKREPTIVIQFEPLDAAAARAAAPAPVAASARPPSDAGPGSASAQDGGGARASVERADGGGTVGAIRPTAAAHAGRPAAPDRSGGAEVAASLACKTTDDCAVVPVDCCDCANGGRQEAMAKRAVAETRAARQAKCKGVMCTMMLSTDPTCGKRAECIEGRCLLVERR